MKRVWVESRLGSLRGWITNFYNYILTGNPQVEEFYIVMIKPKSHHTILANERENFLRFLKECAGEDLWVEEGPLLMKIKERCYSSHSEVAGYVWRMPRLVIDIESLVVDRDVNEDRGGFLLNMVEGNVDVELSSRWREEMFY